LKGKYDVVLSWAAEDRGHRSIGADGLAGVVPEDIGPNIFTALQEQLGLKLEPKKGPISILVVDSVDRTPTEN
jgi:uncharacterized protein (TIGR03435 family)